ncbi:unnamed protein product [Auanema sp. JU1783]|nr:unnamed protein product [Auanema sp. JU1783]
MKIALVLMVCFSACLMTCQAQAAQQVEKRFNDFYSLLSKYQQQKRFNNDYYNMLNRYQERPTKRFTNDFYTLLNKYQDDGKMDKRYGELYNMLARYQGAPTS